MIKLKKDCLILRHAFNKFYHAAEIIFFTFYELKYLINIMTYIKKSNNNFLYGQNILKYLLKIK